jgi:hypothetical protein
MHLHVVSQKGIAHGHGSSNPTASKPTLFNKLRLYKTTQTDLLPSNISTAFLGFPLLFLFHPLNLRVLYSFLSKLYPLIHFIFLSHLSSSYAGTPHDPWLRWLKSCVGQWFQFCSFYHFPLPILIRSLFQYSSLSLYCILFFFYVTTSLTHFPFSQGRPELCPQPVQANNLAPLKATFFQFFRLRTGLANIF